MESIDLKPLISQLNAMFDKLGILAQEIFQANGYKPTGGYMDISDVRGEIVEVTRELIIIDSVISIGEENINSPHTPAELLPEMVRRHADNIAKGKRLSKKGEKLLTKAESIYNENKNIEAPKPAEPVKPVPEKKKEQQAPATSKPNARPIKGGNIIEDVANGKVTIHKLPTNYYNSVRGDIMDSVKKGMGDTKGFEGLAENLNLNAQAFSAAKTYNLVRDLESIKGDKEYNEKAKSIIKQYDIWQEAETNTAQQQTYQAKQWQIIKDDIDLFPILKYSTIGDACMICRPLDGITAPVNSPIWKKIYPCNHYNCYCIVVQLTAGEDLTDKDRMAAIVDESTKLMNTTFLSNPGITQQIYTSKHPYFASVPKDDRDFAKQNFGLPIK